jgi:hypothetical protein
MFGEPKVEIVIEPYKAPAISPFDFINAITYNKNDLMVDDWAEKQYVPYIVNKGLSYGADTVIQANEMRPKKRYNKWIKAEKIESIEVIKQYYGYSTDKARQVLPLLDQSQIDLIEQKLEKGGINNVKRVLQD